MEVWHNHRHLDTFPADYVQTFDAGDLVIRDPSGQEIRRYAAGHWSAAGTQIAHAFIEDDPACADCHPPQEESRAL